MPPRRPLRISVAGAAGASAAEYRLAHGLGRALAEAGAVILCGGYGGVMEAAARGATEAGGLVVGFLKGTEAGEANPWITLPLPTGLGEARNALVARCGDALVAVGGSWGTLSEIALARKAGIDVCLLGPPPVEGLRLERFDDPARAAAWAVDAAERARARRGEGPAEG